MTDKEKVVVMAYTGVTMLTGDKFGIFHKYIEDIMHRPIFTHELGNQDLVRIIKERVEDDFFNICRDKFEDYDGTIEERVSKYIWDICKKSPEYGNAVMDVIGEEAYNRVMELQKED